MPLFDADERETHTLLSKIRQEFITVQADPVSDNATPCKTNDIAGRRSASPSMPTKSKRTRLNFFPSSSVSSQQSSGVYSPRLPPSEEKERSQLGSNLPQQKGYERHLPLRDLLSFEALLLDSPTVDEYGLTLPVLPLSYFTKDRSMITKPSIPWPSILSLQATDCDLSTMSTIDTNSHSSEQDDSICNIENNMSSPILDSYAIDVTVEKDSSSTQQNMELESTEACSHDAPTVNLDRILPSSVLATVTHTESETALSSSTETALSSSTGAALSASTEGALSSSFSAETALPPSIKTLLPPSTERVLSLSAETNAPTALPSSSSAPSSSSSTSTSSTPSSSPGRRLSPSMPGTATASVTLPTKGKMRVPAHATSSLSEDVLILPHKRAQSHNPPFSPLALSMIGRKDSSVVVIDDDVAVTSSSSSARFRSLTEKTLTGNTSPNVRNTSSSQGQRRQKKREILFDTNSEWSPATRVPGEPSSVSSSPSSSSVNSYTDLPAIAINELSAGEDPIYIDPHFVKILKPHQIEGVQFIWHQVISNANGCILAHCMGLGKSLQVVVVVSTLFEEVHKENPTIPKDLQTNRILILAPLVTLANWMNEFDRWLPPTAHWRASHIFNGAEVGSVHNNSLRTAYFREWYNNGGVLLMNYEQFRSLLKKVSNFQQEYEAMLLNPSLVVLDESHRIKNPGASITQCVLKIRTLRRMCLTGYPLQNNLTEYFCMMDFAFPQILGEEKLFKSIYRTPIESIYADSPASKRRLARSRLLQLQLITSAFIQRKEANILHQALPGKTEYFISCPLTPIQHRAYLKLLEFIRTVGHQSLLGTLVLFRSLLNHPAIFNRILTQRQQHAKFHDSSTEVRGEPEDDDQDEFSDVRKVIENMPREWKYFGYSSDDLENWNNSHKIRVILSICRLCKELNEKLVVVSFSIASLDFVQMMLSVNGFNVSRIDGSTPQPNRQPSIDRFNEEKGCDIMLLSAKAGGIGVNITGANRMILMDIDWNPSHDEQSIARVYRYGQKKHVYVYRLQVHSTVEEILLGQGNFKRGITSRVVDNKLAELQMQKDLKEYYRKPILDPESEVTEGIVECLDDTLLAAVIRNQKSSFTSVNTRSSNDTANTLVDNFQIEALSDTEMKTIRSNARKQIQTARAFNRMTMDRLISS